MGKSREIPALKINNYASIFTNPIFKNQDGEWYRDVGYEDSLDIIRDNFVEVRKSFVSIGYYLKHIKEKELYKEGGYQNIWECAEKEFGLSPTAAHNYMQMNDAYSVNGDTPILDKKYDKFNKSQLQEMLALPEEKRDEIKPDQTVTEIRNIAKEEKRLKEPSEKEIRQFYESHIKNMDDEPRSTLKERLKKEYRTAGGSYPFSWRGSVRGICLNKTDEITWAYLVKLIDQYIPKDVEKDSDQETDQKEEQQLPGQMNLEDYPDVLPEKTDHKEKMDTKEKNPNPKTDCPPGISQCIRQEWGFTPEQQRIGSVECTKCWDHWKKQQGQEKQCNSPIADDVAIVQNVSAYGLPKSEYPEGSLISMEGCGNKYDCFYCAQDCEIRGKDRYCREAPMGDPFSCTTMNVLKNLREDMGEECQFINHELAEHTAGSNEPTPCCKECQIYDCGYRCMRAVNAELKDDKESEAEEPEISDQQESAVMKPEKDRILILYELVERAENENDGDAASALRWAIFTLENLSLKIKDLGKG